MTGFDIDFQDKLKTLSEIEQEIKRQVAERLSHYELTMVNIYVKSKTVCLPPSKTGHHF